MLLQLILSFCLSYSQCFVLASSELNITLKADSHQNTEEQSIWPFSLHSSFFLLLLAELHLILFHSVFYGMKHKPCLSVCPSDLAVKKGCFSQVSKTEVHLYTFSSMSLSLTFTQTFLFNSSDSFENIGHFCNGHNAMYCEVCQVT